MTFTVLPVLIAMVLAIAAMPTDVYKICRGEMGFEHARARRHPVSAWRVRAVAFLSRLRAWCAGCRAHPFFMPAATLAAVLLVSLVVPAHLHGAPVMMGAINIKQLQQDDADNKAAQARVKADLGKLLDVPLKDRTAEQKAELIAKRTELTALESSAADLAADLALAQKLQETEKKQAAPPTTPRVELGANHEAEGVSLGEVMQAMAYNAYRSVGRSDQAAMILPSGVAVHVTEAMQAAATGASSGVPESGGVLVRSEWSTALLERVQEQGNLAPKCFSLPIGDGNDGLEAPFVDETSRATGSRWGGVQVYRAAEAATVAAAQPKLGKFELRLEDLMALFYGTTRVIRDATLLEALAMKAFSSEFAFKLDDEIVRGTGAGQCLGIVGNAPTVSVAKETNQAAGTIVYENIIKMYSTLLARCMAGAEWYINQTCLPQLFKMYLAVGTAGVPVYLPANGASASPYGTLMGLPVNVIEQASAVGTVGDIILANLSNDYVLINKPMTSDSSIHVRFINNEITFRWVWPVIGKPVLSAAITPYKGSGTFGPFVTLATRS